MKILKNKKGFSIVEVIVAMVIISIVSVTALSIVSASADTTKAAMHKADAQYFVADAVECFKVSTKEEEFYDALECRGLPGTLTLSRPSAGSDSKEFSGVLNNSIGYAGIVDYQITPEHPNPTLMIWVVDSKGQKLADLTYTKARR